MRITFSGSREGMSESQRLYVADMLKVTQPSAVHHGGCIGADYDFHVLALGLTGAHIFVHPSNLPKKFHAELLASSRVTFLPPMAPLVRNHVMIDALTEEDDRFVATPNTGYETRRSGTWATVRYARKQNRHWTVCKPDGLVSFGYSIQRRHDDTV